MGHMQTLSRRAFLFGSTAVAGGIAFGAYGPAEAAAPSAYGNPLVAGLGPNSVTFNPWVEISPDKITLIAQHADIGQGVGSVQPIMIAEEMDLDPGQFEIRFAGPSPAYFNTGFADEFAPFVAADQSPAAEEARAAVLENFRKSGLQMTGGSSTVPDTYEKLRVAGAVARETLKAAAAKRSGVSVADLRTQSSHVILPDGTKIAYVALAAEASKIPPVLDAKPRDPSKWRILGKPMTRLDVRAKVVGELKFGIDMKMDGMMYASVKLNPNKGQPLRSYDASKARAMPGVRKILEIKNGVAVIATNSWYAIKAADAIVCEWAPSAYPAEQADHWKVLESSFKPEFLGKEWKKIGDVDAGLKTGTRVQAEYRAPYVAHQPLEPLNGIGLVTDNGMEIWVGHQSPQFVQSRPPRSASSRNRSSSTISGPAEALATVSNTRTCVSLPRSPIRCAGRRSSWCSRAKRISCRTFRGRLRSPGTAAASTRAGSWRPICNWRRQLRSRGCSSVRAYLRGIPTANWPPACGTSITTSPISGRRVTRLKACRRARRGGRSVPRHRASSPKALLTN